MRLHSYPYGLFWTVSALVRLPSPKGEGFVAISANRFYNFRFWILEILVTVVAVWLPVNYQSAPRPG